MEDMSNVKDFEELADNIYLIKKGVRSCFMESITGAKEDIVNQERKELSVFHQLQKIKVYIEENGLCFYAYQLAKDKDDADDRLSFIYWAYKYPHQGVILRSLQGKHSYIEEWIIGKLLGYSDEAMEEFLQKRQSKKEG